MEKERQGETQKIIKIDGFFVPSPPIECLCTFLQVFLKSRPVNDQTEVLVLSFPNFTDSSIVL